MKVAAATAPVTASHAETIEALLVRYGANAAAYAQALLNDTFAAEDLVQDVFLAFFKAGAQYDFTERDPKALIFTALTRRAANYRRNAAVRNMKSTEALAISDSGRREVQIVDPRAKSPLQSLEVSERQRVLAEAMSALPEKQRLAFHLRVNEDLAYEQIAEVLSESIDNVGVLISRARASLKKALMMYEREE